MTFQADLSAAGLKAELIYEKLVKLGQVRDCQPRPDELGDIDHLDCLRFQVTTNQSREAVLGQLLVGGVVEAVVEPLADRATLPEDPTADRVPAAAQAEAASDAAAKQRTTGAGQRPTETIRVDTDRLDQLMDLAGQLVINKAQFTQIGDKLKTVVDCNQSAHSLDRITVELDRLGGRGSIRVNNQHLAAELESVRERVRRIRNNLEPLRREVQSLSGTRDSVGKLIEAIHQLGRVSDGIQKGVMNIRMVPIGPLFTRFNRVVRDISRASGKQIRLEIAGEKTELDKRMIDELGDPLNHLVRNSADHGIEPPGHREAAGKPRQGTVSLNAYHRGNSIVIEVRDDGKGLDTGRILRKALDQGLLTEADAERMTTRQIQQLIWKPGLSTADKVSDISGRGMGMDIVKTKIESLSGAINVASEQGKGTTITIKLPLTLAILPSLMVDIAGSSFAVPMEAVTEIVNLGRDRLSTVDGRPMATIRGRVISLVELGDILTFHGSAKPLQSSKAAVVVLSDAGQEIGLAVDRVIGEEDLVIKSIAEHYKNVPGIAGASILGDGRVAFILNVAVLIATLCRKVQCVT